MNMIKCFILVSALAIPMGISTMAQAQLTDEEQMVYTEALQTGNVKVAKKFLDSNASVDDVYFGWQALQIAANKGQLGVVKLLVEKGADINYQHPIIKNTALHLAAMSNHTEVVKYLIAKGADQNIKMNADVSLVSFLRNNGNTKMADLLLASGSKE